MFHHSSKETHSNSFKLSGHDLYASKLISKKVLIKKRLGEFSQIWSHMIIELALALALALVLASLLLIKIATTKIKWTN